MRRGNVGERYSGGIGAGSTHGVGYGGTTSLGSDQNRGSPVVYDRIALWALQGPSQSILDGYQVDTQ